MQPVSYKAVSRSVLGTTFHLILDSTYSAGSIPTRPMLFLRRVTQQSQAVFRKQGKEEGGKSRKVRTLGG